MNKAKVLGLCAVLAVVLLGGVGWYLFGRYTAAPADALAPGAAEIIGANEWHTMGNSKAKVVVIEYAAHTCPVCAIFNEHTFPDLKARYIDTGKVFYVYRLLPIDQADGKAAEIAACLPPEGYFTFVDLLYRRQDEWGPEQMNEHGAPDQPKTDAGLLKIARVSGLDAAKAQACLTSKTVDERVNKVAADGAARYGVNATPTIIINGHVLEPGARTPQEVAQVIDPLLTEK
jgi:protein-disulfide isomerase